MEMANTTGHHEKATELVGEGYLSNSYQQARKLETMLNGKMD
jgi:hypothetical protein